jgi:hypothetical protein
MSGVELCAELSWVRRDVYRLSRQDSGYGVPPSFCVLRQAINGISNHGAD